MEFTLTFSCDTALAWMDSVDKEIDRSPCFDLSLLLGRLTAE